MILVTGASGHLGKLVVQNLLKTVPASQIAAMARDAAKVGDLKAKGADIRTGDYHDPASMEVAFQGIEKLLLVSSGDVTGRLQQHKNAIDAAKKAGVKHIFYTGVKMKDIHASPLKPLLGDHFQTESYIRASGLTYTFLQNGMYYENLPMFLGEKVQETGIFYPVGDGKVAFVSREDLAEATAKILTSVDNENKTYDLAGPKAVSFGEIAEKLNTAYLNPDEASFVEALKQMGVPEPIVQMGSLFAAGMKNNDFEVPGADIEQVLGRKAKSLSDYLKETFMGN